MLKRKAISALKYLLSLSSLFLLACSTPTEYDDLPGPIEYASVLSSISIDGKNLNEIVIHSYGGNPPRVDMFWLGEREQFLVRYVDLHIYGLDGELIKFIQKPNNIINMDVSPDGNFAVLACNGSVADLYLLNTITFEMKRITDTPNMVERDPRFSSDGEKIVYVTTYDKTGNEPLSLNLYDLSADSSQTLLVNDEMNTDANPFNRPCFGKNDEIIYVIRYFSDSSIGSNGLHALELNNKKSTLIDTNINRYADMKYAHIGDRLVYLSRKPYKGIRVFDASVRKFYDLGDRVKTEGGTGPNQLLNINPEGTKVVAGTDYARNSNLYSIDVETGEYVTITKGNSPELSPDGTTVLFVLTQPQED